MAKPTVAVRMNADQIDILLEAMEGYNTDKLDEGETQLFEAMLARLRVAEERVTKKGA